MKTLVVLFLSILSCAVLADYSEGSAHERFQPVEPGQQIDSGKPLDCEERSCNFNAQDEPQELDGVPSYLNLCEKFHLKMQELESFHPELKQAKLELLKKLETYFAEFDSRCKDGESVVFKILNFVLYVVEKLKVDFEKKLKRPISFIELPVDRTPVEEIIAEEVEHPPFIGSIRGIPGFNYPNYSEVPITSFSCSDKKHIPGFYADLETGCQVFHVCYEHRRESFLCPLGTIFNQPLLACDYWYSSNCSQAPIYYDENKVTEAIDVSEEEEEKIEELITNVIEGKTHDHSKKLVPQKEMENLIKFFPVKAKVVEFPEHKPVVPEPSFDVDETADKIFDGIFSAGIHTVSKATTLLKSIPEPKTAFKMMPNVIKPFPIKSKLAAKTFSTVPIAKSKIVASAAVPMKAKLIASAAKAKTVAAAIPVVKGKVAAAAAVPVFKAKAVSAAAIPIVKAKVAYAGIPMIKSKFVAAALPVVKAKKIAPYVKMAAIKPKFVVAPLKAKAVMAGIPMMKAKLAKAAMISPLTTKALALGYMKLLKAKKLALMG